MNVAHTLTFLISMSLAGCTSSSNKREDYCKYLSNSGYQAEEAAARQQEAREVPLSRFENQSYCRKIQSVSIRGALSDEEAGQLIDRIKGLMPDHIIVELMRYKDFVFVSTQVNCNPPVNGHYADWTSEGHAFVFRKEEARESDGPTWQVLSVFGMFYN